MSLSRRQLLAGGVFLLGFVYVIIEVLAARAWVNPPYNWALNYISDLGYSDCARVLGRQICSPLHPLMNLGFMIQGLVFVIGALLVVRVIVERRSLRWIVDTLLVTSGVGTFFVGVFHQSLALSAAGLNWLHFTAATLAIGPGNVGIVLLGILAARTIHWRSYGIAILSVGLIGVVSSLLLVAGFDFGIGKGFIERIAVYPLNTWTIGSGVGLTVVGVRDFMHTKRLRSAAPNQ
ncbi:MAG: DUF998 domain-containing protein [Microbacteriaceae bacterium]|nr:DUF998 domain-containing protein [Microbacteriaceae bacterium]